MINIMIRLLLVTCLTIATLATPFHKTELNQSWKMQVLSGSPLAESAKGKTFETSLPTTVHLDLQKAGEIPNSLLEENYPKVKWVSECDYLYSTTFTLSDEAFKHPYQKLVFEGIDTYSSVTLNGKPILTTSNAFRQYSVQVGSILKQGENKLEVRINSTKTYDQLGQSKENMPFEYAHSRKACYQYSWDWAPYLNTAGIWKPVHLQSYDEVKIDYVWARTRAVTKDRAIINFAIALELPSNSQGVDNYQFSISQNGIHLSSFSAHEQYTYHDVNIENPKLWWPNGIGEAHIYDFKVQLLQKVSKNTVKVDERDIPFGIRTVELDLKGRKFEVVVNGYPIYCKGANYVPPDMFYPRLENPSFKPENTIESLLEDAVASNFNMIRVWGGGQYESNKFLELASRKGIMLFYDFMFSDSVYPSGQEFLLNVEEEIKQQVRRARNYPALTLWSGNNEILQGVQDWGWGSKQYRENYHKLFEVLIPKIIQYESPYIPYIPSSPIYGVGNYGFERGGDAHYWGVWAGSSPFESYRSSVAKFNSQFGTQALPVWETILQGMSKTPGYDDPALSLHERHNSRFNTLKSYMSQYMHPSQNFEMETYQSGLLQAYAIEIAIKTQRIAKPKSAGTLYWQMNDAWPSISWSSIDYYGRWKPLQFMAKRLYPDVAIFTQEDKVYAVSDELYPVKALSVIEIFDLRGTQLKKIESEIKLAANEVKMIYEIKDEDYGSSKKEECMVYTEIVAGKNQTMISTHFNGKFKKLKLYPVQIDVQYHSDFNTIIVETKSTVVKNLFISRKSKYLKVTNNYFDLVPGYPVKVTLLGEDKLADIKEDLVFRSYRDSFTQDSSVKAISK